MRGRLADCLLVAVSLCIVSTTDSGAQISSGSHPIAAKTILTQGEDSMKKSLEKAKSSLASIPIKAGKPSLTEDRRKEISEAIHKIAEEFRAAIRNERRQMEINVNKAERDKKITEEERKKAEERLQTLTDEYIQKIEELVAAKEKELMDV